MKMYMYIYELKNENVYTYTYMCVRSKLTYARPPLKRDPKIIVKSITYENGALP